MPRWLRPACSGALLGAMAIFFPHIIGVGYETTSLALTGELALHNAVIFAVLKSSQFRSQWRAVWGRCLLSSLMVGR